MKKTTILALAVFLVCLIQAQSVVDKIYYDVLSLKDYGLTSPLDIRAGAAKLNIYPDKKTMSLRLDTRIKKDPTPSKEPKISRKPQFIGDYFVVSEFESGLLNNLDGYFSTYDKSPATASLAYFNDPKGFQCLGLSYAFSPEGYCGMWFHLVNRERPGQDMYFFDVTPFSCLSLWVRGKYGGEKILLKISDKTARARDVSANVGELDIFLPTRRISQEWQLAVIPLSSLPAEINRRELASLTFQVVSGESSVFFRTMAFCKDEKTLPPFPESKKPDIQTKAIENTFWVWRTSSIIQSEEQIKQLLDFIDFHGFSRVFLQIPGDAKDPALDLGIGLRAKALRPLLSALNERGIKVYALDGSSEFALKENHGIVLNTMNKVIQYNRSSESHERFCGFHWDIEPYTLRAFRTPKQAQIFREYLEIHEKMAFIAHEADLEIGASIPFWFDSGEIKEIFLGGDHPGILETMIKLMDHIAIMSYRTTAFGPSGTVAVSLEELNLAKKYGTEVFIGLETTSLPDEYQYAFQGPPRRGMPRDESGGNYLFLVKESGDYFGYLVPSNEISTFQDILEEKGKGSNSALHWLLGRPTRVEGNWLSFHNLGADRLFSVYKQTKIELSRYKSFTGFAIHYYKAFKELLTDQSYSLKDY